MKLLETLVASPLAAAVGWTLLHSYGKARWLPLHSPLR